METHATVSPGLPRNAPTLSYWQNPPSNTAKCRSTETLPEKADVVIVGSGISGASIARNLLEHGSGIKILMLEARQAASGASGRNGGHTKHASYRTFGDNVRNVGQEDAIKIAQLEYNCMLAVQAFIEENRIDCDLEKIDTVDIFYDEDQYKDAISGVSLMKKALGESSSITRYEFFPTDETTSRFLTPNSLGSLKYEAGSLSSYKLTIGILELALKQGLNLQTDTPVKQIQKFVAADGSCSWLVHTDRGTVKTSKLILATNGYTAHLYSPLQGAIIPFRGIVTAQRPGKKMPQTGLPTTYSFMYKNGYDYMITRPAGSLNQGDIVIGGGITKGQGQEGANEYGNSDDTQVEPLIEQYLNRCTLDFFGHENWGDDHEDGRIRQTWSGIMGYSADGHPLVGPVPGEEGLYLDVSFQGHGMVMCFLCADAVAKMVLGKDGPELDKWFPQCFRVTAERMKKKFSFDSLH